VPSAATPISKTAPCSKGGRGVAIVAGKLLGPFPQLVEFLFHFFDVVVDDFPSGK
jgi:hypothetical protein